LNQKIPQHVAIVMDGNGRWAENSGLPRVEGHRAGVEIVKAIVQACLEKNIAMLSLFAFSCENWARPADEVDFLMQLFIVVIGQETERLNEHGICLKFIGDRDRLSSELRSQMDSAEKLTANNKKLHLNIAINYSGKWDIVQAMRAVVSHVLDGSILPQKIDEQLFTNYLSTAQLPDPDLFIRTSGEQRISDFFLWQLAYTELYFTEVKWPEFTVEEFEQALHTYSLRERRYGLISKQLNNSLEKSQLCLDNAY